MRGRGWDVLGIFIEMGLVCRLLHAHRFPTDTSAAVQSPPVVFPPPPSTHTHILLHTPHMLVHTGPLQFHGIQVGDVKDARLAARRAKSAPRKKGGEARLLEVDDGRPDRGGGKSGCCCAIL